MLPAHSTPDRTCVDNDCLCNSLTVPRRPEWMRDHSKMTSSSHVSGQFYPVAYDMLKPPVLQRPTWEDVRPGGHELKRLVVELGKPLVLMGRNSTVGGRAGTRATAADAHLAAKSLRDLTGWDVTGLLPEQEEMSELLFTSRNVVHSVERDGSPFHNQFRLLDFSDVGLYVSLSAGSGMKSDASWAQPHAVWTLKVLQELEPTVSGFFVKRFDRFVRTSWGPGAPLYELRYMRDHLGGAWAGDEDGVLSLDESHDLTVMVKSMSAQRDGKKITTQRMQNIPLLSGNKMVGGRVKCSVPVNPPPGLMMYRDRERTRWLSLDTTKAYPKERSEAIFGLPDVFLPNGKRADQVKTVMWFLSEVYRDGRPPSSFTDELVKRRFSTHAMRSRPEHGDAAYFGSKAYREHSKSNAEQWTGSIFTNLEFYKTGVLRLRYGKKEHEVVEVTGVFPKGGRWASPEDFARIERARGAAVAWRAAARRGWSMSGLNATLDGYPVTLRPTYSTRKDDPVSWSLKMSEEDLVSHDQAWRDQSSGEEGIAPKRTIPPVSDEVLVGAMLRGLWQADGTALRSRFATPDLALADAARDAEREALIVEREDVVAVQAHERFLLSALGPDRKPVLSTVQAQRDMAVQYASREGQLAEIDEKLSALRAASVDNRPPALGVTVEEMSSVIAGLVDPTVSPHRDLLTHAVQDLRFTSKTLREGRYHGVAVSFTGDLVFADGRDDYVVPFRGSYEGGMASRAEGIALEALARLRSGVPNGGTPKEERAMTIVAELLGVDRKHFTISTCPDPALLKLGMAALFPDPVPGEDPSRVPILADLAADPSLIEQFGDVGELAKRMVKMFSDTKSSQWTRSRGGSREANGLVRSALIHLGKADGGSSARSETLVGYALRDDEAKASWVRNRKQHPMIRPCVRCGGIWFAMMRFREAQGYVCLEPTCRYDRSAVVRWPNRFDAFIRERHLYEHAGLALASGPDFEPDFESAGMSPPGSLVDGERRWRVRSDLGADEAAEILHAYLETSEMVYLILRRHTIMHRTLDELLVEAGEDPRQSGRRNQPPRKPGCATP